MEKDREHKQHRCRICRKSFPCGRSLGGHMRSHSVSSDAEKGKKLIEKIEEKEKKPNKTCWRLSGEASKLCKECGKEFPSWKALYGHMRCHSDKTFWRCFEAGHEQERDSVPIAAAAASSSSTTEYEPEQEDVAISLMMLSRDVGGCWIPSEPSDEQSAFLEEDELNEAEDSAGDESGRSRNNLNAAEFVKKVDENSNEFNAFEAKMGKDVLKLQSRYHQCTTCNRTFHSYQALGGHRASHKRMRGCSLMKVDGISNDAKQLTGMMDNDSLSGLSKKSRSFHECSICKRTFSSGQALGGHKRSHLVPNGDGGGHSHHAAVVEVPELLDLNIPAPMEEEEELSNVKPWWAGESFKHERALVGLISN